MRRQANAAACDVGEADQIDSLLVATVGLAFACALWRAASAVDVFGQSWELGIVAVGLAVAQSWWAITLARHQRRAAYRTGALLVGVPLAASVALTTIGVGGVSAAGEFGPGEILAVAIQLVLFVLILIGWTETGRPRVLRTAAAIGLITAAVGTSALVGGATHQHAATLRAGQAPPVFICHLL